MTWKIFIGATIASAAIAAVLLGAVPASAAPMVDTNFTINNGSSYRIDLEDTQGGSAHGATRDIAPKSTGSQDVWFDWGQDNRVTDTYNVYSHGTALYKVQARMNPAYGPTYPAWSSCEVLDLKTGEQVHPTNFDCAASDSTITLGTPHQWQINNVDKAMSWDIDDSRSGVNDYEENNQFNLIDAPNNIHTTATVRTVDGATATLLIQTSTGDLQDSLTFVNGTASGSSNYPALAPKVSGSIISI